MTNRLRRRPPPPSPSPPPSPPPPPIATTWDPANLSGINLSNNNLSATISVPKGCVRTTTSKSTGKVHIEIKNEVSYGDPTNYSVGLVNSAFVLGSNLPGVVANSIGIWDLAPMQALINGSTIFTAASGTMIQGDIVAFELDFDAKTVKYQNATSGPYSWSSAISFVSLTGPFFFAFSDWDPGAKCTINCGGSTFAVPLSSGYSAWDSSSSSPPSPPPPSSGKVTRSGSQLMLNGSSYRMIGYNMWSAATDTNFFMPAIGVDVSAATFNQYLSDIKATSPHINTIRIFGISQDTLRGGSRNWSAIDSCLTVANNHGCKILWSLEDFYDYERTGASTYLCGNYAGFFAGGWQTTPLSCGSGGASETYQSWITAVAQRYHDDPRIVMFELMNEPGQMTVSFAQGASQIIRQYDSTTPICSGGWLGTNGPSPNEAAILALSTIDVATMHYYAEFSNTDYHSTVSLAHAKGKPWFLGEYGVDKSLGLSGRAAQIRSDLTAFFSASNNPVCCGTRVLVIC